MTAKTIAFTNQKGGVGKTTTCINLGASLAAMDKRVLLIDLDPQGNITMGSGVEKNQQPKTICDVLLDELPINNACQYLEKLSYDLVPANGDLTAAEVGLLDKEDRELILKNAIEQVKDNYDYILIDCPPSLNMLTVNALVAADGIIIPMQCEYYALEGLTALLSTVRQIQQASNPQLRIFGIVRTMFDPRNRLAVEVSRQLFEYFDDKVYRTVIPRNVRLAEAPSHGVPAIFYDRHSRGATAYLMLAGEFIRREEESQTISQTPDSTEQNATQAGA